MLREEYQELLDSKISLHDKRRFEVKLDINLAPGHRNEYVVEAYFFVPRSLDVNKWTYPPERFYSDVQNYIRFKTPVISLGKLMDDSYEYSPFVQLERFIDRLSSGEVDEETVDRAVHEIKILGCIVRSTVRDFVHFSLGELRRLAAQEISVGARAKALEESTLSFARLLRFVLERVRAQRSRLVNPGLPLRVRESYLRLDEFLSLTVESYFTVFLDELSRRQQILDQVPSLDEMLKSLLAGEQQHRVEMGYPSVLSQVSDNEDFAPRRSLLKKFISSILFLQIDVRREYALKEFIFGTSAFAVMVLYLGLMFMVQSRFTSNSLPFVMLASVSYLFKDRIKEWLRTYFTRVFGEFISDHKVSIIDPASGETIGSFRESFHFMKPRDVPTEVMRLHTLGHEVVAEEGRSEEVMKYFKGVRLDADNILSRHHRLRSLNDILRFSIANFLLKTDDPKEDNVFLNPSTGQLDHVRLSRTYDVDVVLRFATLQADGRVHEEFEKIRLVLDRKGIKRLEILSPEAVAAGSVLAPSRD